MIDFDPSKRQTPGRFNGSRQTKSGVTLALVLLSALTVSSLVRSPFATQKATVKRSDELARGSKRAIVETGISEPFFNAHFTLIKVFDNPGDQRVLWKFRINEYETTVNDAIGFYTAPDGQRVYVHSIKNLLRNTHDITSTISKRRAERLMKICLGKYSGGEIVLIPLAPAERTSLYFTAHSMGEAVRIEKERDPQSKDRKRASNPDRDQPEGEQKIKKRSPIYIGYINLETGKCIKGKAIATP